MQLPSIEPDVDRIQILHTKLAIGALSTLVGLMGTIAYLALRLAASLPDAPWMAFPTLLILGLLILDVTLFGEMISEPDPPR